MQPADAKTEQGLADLRGFDTWSNDRILATLLAGQRRALDAVEQALPALSKAADLVAPRIAGGGKLIYAGAGTSIRVAVQDGTELPATFGMKEAQLAYLIAGGRNAMFDTLADAEDDAAAGRAAASICTSKDALIAIAASGHTPYTVAAAEEAKSKKCCVIAIVNNAGSPLAAASDHAVLLDTGPEVISGSTRMGAGTSQKAALNLLSTLVHTKLGGVHDGLMVNMRAENEKLKARAARIVAQISNAQQAEARAALDQASGHIKLAVILCAGAKSLRLAQQLLADTGNNLRLALEQLTKKQNLPS
jgi:N-acetylmuramic acid 6-phosphate etherase